MSCKRLGSVAVACACIGGLVSARASAQDIEMSALGSIAEESFGESAAWGPDLDGDGFREIVVGAPMYWPSSSELGSVYVLSGRDFSRMKSITGPKRSTFGWAVCWCGDVDGDGVPDLAVGAPSFDQVLEPKVYIYSSTTWTNLRVLRGVLGDQNFGYTIADAGDVNGDGVDDLLIGAPGASGFGLLYGGSAHLFSGADGSTIWTISGGSIREWLGNSVAAIGDINGDGIVDLAIGEPGGAGTSGYRDAGAVDVVSGADGSVLLHWSGQSKRYSTYYGGATSVGDEFGRAVGSAGDFDGDGIPDVWVSSWTSVSYSGAYIQVFSGATGATLLTIVTPEWTQNDAAAIADVNGDGRAEFVSTGGLYNPQHSVFVFSSVDGKVLWRTDANDLADATVASDRPTSSHFILGRPDFSDVLADAGKIELRAPRNFWLDVAPTHFPYANDTLTFTAADGPNGNPAGLFVTAVNGAPTFLFLTLATFDATGAAALAAGTVPPGLAGNTVALRAVGVAANGHLVQTADELLTLR